MFTSRRFNVIAATAIAGAIGTVGIVAAGSSGSTTSSSPASAAPSPTPDGPTAPAPTEPVATTPAATTAATTPAASATAGEAAPTAAPGATDAAPAAKDGASATPSTASEPSNPDTEPADPERPAPGEPGVVDGEEGTTDPPPPPPPPPPSDLIELASVPKPPPPLPPIPGPVDLVTLPMDPGPGPIDDYAAPVDPTPWNVGTDFQVVAIPGYLGDFSSGYSGCQLECVTTALLSSNPVNPNVQLDATTTVPVHFEVEVNETYGDWGKHFNNPGYDTEWSTTLGPLQPDTTYDLTLIAIDQDGHSKVYEHQFTTVAIIDGFASNAKGCALACITEGTVEIDGAPNDVEVHVKTNTPAALQVWLSTFEPTWVDDPDAKPAYDPVHESDTPSTSTTFDVKDLEYATLYHVVARAHDDHGDHYRVGTFQTGAEPQVDVLVTFEEITVTHDGDEGDSNRGEIRFSWGFDGTGIGGRSEQKMHPGKVSIDGSNAKWFRFDPTAESIPNPTIGAHERDWDGLIEWCSYGWGPGVEPSYVADCDMKTNVAHHGGPVSLEQIEAFPPCSQFGVDAGAGARCAALGSSVFGTRDPDYVHFSAVVSFVVHD
ncbi:MAG: hypothetical protein QNJ12_02550 [Ilumatobacter sp.]|uniref:hypothetical protein n=1 Tax=Ilumatobacter sp. TaxID=1967498 RepID=UPI002617B227|nr:hypothetical protein [Ilumatobacter sp.]MDJ0767638.1 hypothetical protein [Ilumatobacter sp.]